jgi:SAM-dependent methyltransferase
VDASLSAPYEAARVSGAAAHIDEARRRLFAAQLARLAPSGGGRCLDVGSGGGLFVRLAAAAGWDALGIDPAGPELEGAGFRLARLPFPPTEEPPMAPFALVTFFNSLTYMLDPVAALRAAHALLEPGGVVIVRVPNVSTHLGVLRVADALGPGSRAGDWLRRASVLHPRAFSPRALAVALARAGFVEARVSPSVPVPGDPYRTHARGLVAAKVVVGAATRALAAVSRGRLVWSPSLEGRAVRGPC